MEKLYSLAFLILPILTQSQQVAYYIKPVPSGFTFRASRSAPNDDGRISADEVAKNIGRYITVCGKVYSAKQQKDELGEHSVFYVGGKYVNEFVDIRIRLDEGCNFTGEMYKTVTSKNLCITGTVLNETGVAAIYLDSVNMRNLVTEAEHAQPALNAESLHDQQLKVISNAYLLTGPRWKDPVITFLKAGSVIIAEQIRGNWAFVRVIERNGENVEVEDIAGYINTKPLGLGPGGKIIIPR